MSDLLPLSKSVLALARKEGAQDAAVNAWRSRDVETTWRDGKIEKVYEKVKPEGHAEEVLEFLAKN